MNETWTRLKESLSAKFARLLPAAAVFVTPGCLLTTFDPLPNDGLFLSALHLLVTVAALVWTTMLPFAAWAILGDREMDNRSAISFAVSRYRQVTAYAIGMYLLMFLLMIPVVTLVFIIGSIGGSFVASGTVPTVLVVLVSGLLLIVVRYRLLLVPILMIRRDKRLGEAARCSNTIIAAHRSELAVPYLVIVVGPALLSILIGFVAMGSPLQVAVGLVVCFLIPLLSAIYMMVTVGICRTEIEQCGETPPGATDEEGARGTADRADDHG
jgi:hypothetical protein